MALREGMERRWPPLIADEDRAIAAIAHHLAEDLLIRMETAQDARSVCRPLLRLQPNQRRPRNARQAHC